MWKKIKAAVIAALVICLSACNSGNNVPDGNYAEEASLTVSESSSGTENYSLKSEQETEQEFDYNDTYLTNEIIFPAHEMDKTEFNAHIFEIPRFTVSFDLPAFWTTGIPAEGEKSFCDLLWSPVNIYGENGEVVGTIAYNTFEIYDDTTEENFHRMVYNQIMLGSVESWGEEYVPIKTDSTGEIAAARVRVRDTETREETFYPAILAYDLDLLVYIGMQFDTNAITEQQVWDIAESITFAPYDTASFIDDDPGADSHKEYSDPAELCADYLEEYINAVFTGSEFDIQKYSSDEKLVVYAQHKYVYERNHHSFEGGFGTLRDLVIHTDRISQGEKDDGTLWLTVPYEVSYGDDSAYGRAAYFEVSEKEDGSYELTIAVDFGYGDDYLINGASYEKQQPPFDIDLDVGIENARKYLGSLE